MSRNLKHILSMGLTAMLLAGGLSACQDFSGLDRLETWRSEVDAKLSALRQQLEDYRLRDKVTGSKELPDGSLVISFKDSPEITLTHGNDAEDFLKSFNDSDPDILVVELTDGTIINLPRYQAPQLGFDQGGYFCWEPGTPGQKTVSLELDPALKEEDFLQLTASIEVLGDGADAFTKLTAAEEHWQVKIIQPTFENGKVVPGSARVLLEAPRDKVREALLHVALHLKDGKIFEISRFVKRQVKVGDIVMENGKVFQLDEIREDERNSMRAIVFTAGPEGMSPALLEHGFTHGIAMSLQQEILTGHEDKLYWSSFYGTDEGLRSFSNPQDYYDNSDGYAVHLYTKNSPEYQDKYRAAAAAAVRQQELHPVTGACSGWYLPSCREWMDILLNLGKLEENNREKLFSANRPAFNTESFLRINAAMEATGLTGFTPLTKDTYWWTSSQFEGAAWILYWRADDMFYIGYTVKYLNTATTQVRSVVAF